MRWKSVCASDQNYANLSLLLRRVVFLPQSRLFLEMRTEKAIINRNGCFDVKSGLKSSPNEQRSPEKQKKTYKLLSSHLVGGACSF